MAGIQVASAYEVPAAFVERTRAFEDAERAAFVG